MEINKYLKLDDGCINEIAVDPIKLKSKMDEFIYLWIKDLYASNFELFQIKHIISNTLNNIESKILEEKISLHKLDVELDKSRSTNICGVYVMLISSIINNCGDLIILEDFEITNLCDFLARKYPNDYLIDIDFCPQKLIEDYDADDDIHIILAAFQEADSAFKLDLNSSLCNYVIARQCYGEFIENFESVKYELTKME